MVSKAALSPLAHPPRPRLVCRVGVTGHRWGSSLEPSAIPRIRTQLQALLRRCTLLAGEVHRQHADVFSPETPRLVALCCMAEGGDRLFATEALAAGWRFETVLPFAADEFEKDFPNEAAKAEYRALLGRAAATFEIGDARREEDPSEAYETAGMVMLDHADLIVAIWDGGESRGRGGTREIADEAIRRGIPVIWIRTTSAEPAALWDGQVATPLPEFDSGGSGESVRFDETVRATLAPPHGGEGTGTAAKRLQRFLEATEKPPPWWTIGYDVMLRLTAHRPLRFPVRLPSIASREHEWDGFIGDLPPAGPLSAELKDVLLRRFLWADRTADLLGRAYRGAYVLNFTLAALSVFVGLLVVFAWDSAVVKTVCAVMEFFMISLILIITRAGARGAWHGRYLDARRLAEMLRHTRVLAPLGRASGGGEAQDAGEIWTAWYAKAARRELSVPNARADADYLRAVSAATVKHEVEPQLAYHRTNHKRLHDVHHGLDHLGERLFYLTALLCVVWVIAFGIYELHLPYTGWIKTALKPTLTFLSAVLPAIGAALAGIRAQGDFQAAARQSLTTERELEAISERLHHGQPAGFREACILQLWIADTMASDLGSWRSLYSNRPLTIPG